MLYLIAHGIAGDRRREDVATLLSGYGPRVQLSVSGCELRSRREATALGAKLRALIDAIADQVRIYPLDERTARGVVVLGAGDRGTPGLLGRLVTRYTSAPDQADGRRLAHTNTHVSGLFCGACPETLAAAGCSSEDGARTPNAQVTAGLGRHPPQSSA